MMRLARAAALTALARSIMYSPAAASDDISTTSPETGNAPDGLSNSRLSLNIVNSATPSQQYTVLPLTTGMGANGSQNSALSMNIRGDIALADQNNYNKLTGLGHIAYLCCDDADKRDNFDISPDKMLNQLMGANLTAIVLYSASTNWCSFERNDGPSYSSIVTMADKGDAADVLHHIQNKPSNESLTVTITGNATSKPDISGDGRGKHSTVAMSVLYSITGLITLLFLAIIITGTVRAHRHPERYGPHGGFGRRPRQSRAKGIARAMLDTLPIVKFGNDEHAKPDPDLELDHTTAEHGTATREAEEAVAAGGLGSGGENTPKKEEAKEAQAVTKDSREKDKVSDTADGADADAKAETAADAGIGPAAGPADETAAESATAQEESERGDEHLGCSICTEDFTLGEDLRVLPCNHRFHPDCVDPWLVNVSGTCPLCRYDLQPGQHAATPGTEAAPELPPPLALEAEDQESTTSSRHRASRLFEINRLRHLSQQERIAALRAMRTRNEDPQAEGQETTTAAAAAATTPTPGATEESREQAEEENGRATRLAAKLRDKFRIRTRAQT